MASTDTPVLGSKAAGISNMVVRLTSQYTGRGPTKARTYLDDNLVTVILQDSLTKAELTLVGHGHLEIVRRTRGIVQDMMEPVLIAGVEEILGRDVVAFLGSHHVDPDYAAEVFILAPSA